MRRPEEEYLTQLNDYLIRGNLTAFENLVNRLKDHGVSIDLSSIPNLNQTLSELFVGYLPDIDSIFGLLRFANKFELFEKINEKIVLQTSKDDLNLRKMNLESLFGPLSEGFLQFIEKYLPTALSEFIINPHLSSAFNFWWTQQSTPLERITDIYSFIDLQYSNYGLRTRKLGTFKQYLQTYKKHRTKFDEDLYVFETSNDIFLNQLSISPRLIMFHQSIFSEKHLLNPSLLETVKKKFEQNEYKYEFPLVSMVIFGGVGPEGKGFTYLTPYGEIIEVCSDVKQNKAYIIEYKKYLKSLFLHKMDKQMQEWGIDDPLKTETLNFFDDNIRERFVGFRDVETLIEDKILSYLRENVESYITPEFLAFLRKSIQEILLPVQMEDQFKVRLDLIKDNKLNETEIAKLASLGNVSHYDILNQRFFLRNLVGTMIQVIKAKE